MADAADLANDFVEAHLDRSVRAARQPLPHGVAGTCARCEEDMPRLVNGLCGYCRDNRKAPAHA